MGRVKNKVAIRVYKIIKKIFSIIIIKFLFIAIDNPVKNNEKGNSIDISPID